MSGGEKVMGSYKSNFRSLKFRAVQQRLKPKKFVKLNTVRTETCSIQVVW